MPIPEEVVQKYQNVMKLVKEGVDGERAAAMSAAAKMEKKYPGIAVYAGLATKVAENKAPAPVKYERGFGVFAAESVTQDVGDPQRFIKFGSIIEGAGLGDASIRSAIRFAVSEAELSAGITLSDDQREAVLRLVGMVVIHRMGRRRMARAWEPMTGHKDARQCGNCGDKPCKRW
jgi:hypothetical protein